MAAKKRSMFPYMQQAHIMWHMGGPVWYMVDISVLFVLNRIQLCIEYLISACLTKEPLREPGAEPYGGFCLRKSSCGRSPKICDSTELRPLIRKSAYVEGTLWAGSLLSFWGSIVRDVFNQLCPAVLFCNVGNFEGCTT